MDKIVADLQNVAQNFNLMVLALKFSPHLELPKKRRNNRKKVAGRKFHPCFDLVSKKQIDRGMYSSPYSRHWDSARTHWTHLDYVLRLFYSRLRFSQALDTHLDSSEYGAELPTEVVQIR